MYSAMRGHSLKLFKKRSHFSNRVVDDWTSLTEDIVNAPCLNVLKSRLNRFWQEHLYKFSPSCYSPGKPPEKEYRTRMYQKRPMVLIRCLHRYISKHETRATDCTSHFMRISRNHLCSFCSVKLMLIFTKEKHLYFSWLRILGIQLRFWTSLVHVEHCSVIPLIRLCYTLSWSWHQNVVTIVQLGC